jgi:hypothetical protein
VDTVDPSPASETAGTTLTGTKVNFYTVTTSRTLLQIEMYMEPSSAVGLTWFVHEAATQSGAYTQIFTTNTTSGTGAGYQSSGPIAVPLVAGRYYAISVRWTTSAAYRYHAAGTVPLSFGTLTSGQMITGTGTPTVAYTSGVTYYAQRLTTGP